jgi:transcriptional regulator with XRE-family HTH domain
VKKGIRRPKEDIGGLAAALAAARRRAGLNQKELAARIGADQSYVSKVERGAVDLQASTLIEFARAQDLELMLIPRQLVPAVQALQREIAPDPRSAPSKIDQDLIRLSRHARELAQRYPALSALSELAATADELRIARVDESSAAKARPLIDSADAIIAKLRRFPRERPDIELSTLAAGAGNELRQITRALTDLRNQWVHREAPSTPVPAYRLGDDDA